MKRKSFYIFMSIALAMLFVVNASAQRPRLVGDDRRNLGTNMLNGGSGAQADSIDPNSIPKGYYIWTIDERFGTIRPQKPDTLSDLFQNKNYVDGVRGGYAYTGNYGAPRRNMLYSGQQDYMMGSQFVFAKPYDFYLPSTNSFIFTNTKSPIATLSYHSGGGKQDGDDRFRAEFATNINKRAGIGGVLDYAYGRGYYRYQSHSSFGGSLYGSYRGDRYQLHSYFNSSRVKNLENGGLEDEIYVVNPEAFPTTYRPQDMPVRLEGVKNLMNLKRLFLTHRYSLGFYEFVDTAGKVVRRFDPRVAAKRARTEHRAAEGDSMQALVAQVAANDEGVLRDTTLTRRFVPVAAFIHTMNVEGNDRQFSTKQKHDNYFKDFFYADDAAKDQTSYFSLQNTLALEMQEGFRRWVKTGMRLYAKHELARFTLPNQERVEEATTFNYITLGAQLMREKAKTFRYNVLGEIRTTGEDWGEFNIEGNVGLHLLLKSDTLRITARGFVRNENPAFYYRHFHGRNAWWDVDLNKTFRFRAEGELAYRAAKLRLGLETVQNHVYLQETIGTTAATPTLNDLKYGVNVAQMNGNISLLSLAYNQHFRFGILNWEHELTFQQSSDANRLPLPTLTAWANVYLKFRIARVLDTQLGVDGRYFTDYYAPAYSPIVGMYVVQDETYRTKVGNYPWLNAYLNFTLKGVRFYLAYSHFNQSAGRYFLVPHYPTPQTMLRTGISWTFNN